MLHLVHILEATTGGTRRHLGHIVRGLDRGAFRQSLIVSTLRDPSFARDIAEYEATGIDVRIVPMRRSPSLSDPAAAMRIRRELNDLQPDIVHTHSSKAGILGRWAAASAGVGMRIHTPHVFAFQMQPPSGLRALYILAERLAARRTHLLVCVSEAEARAAKVLGGSKPRTIVVRNGTAAPDTCPATARADKPLTAILPGRLCRQKGQDILAEALLLKPRLAGSFRFSLIGVRRGEPLPPAVRRAAEEGLLEVKEPFEQSAESETLRRSDIILMPSRWEGLPYMLLESMAAARCILATEVGGIPEVVENNVSGVLIPPENPAALAAALAKIAAEPGKIAPMGENAYRAVKQKFTLEAMLENLSKVYLGEHL